MKRCMGCMRLIDDNAVICPYCSYNQSEKKENENFLSAGTVLAGRYIIGKALGSGGFGITYIAWDSMLEQTVAIKEFFPSAFVSRTQNGVSVRLSDPKMLEQFETGRRKAIDESRCLARLGDVESVTDVYDCIEENNTAYIIMEFLDGITLKQRLEERGKLTFEEAMKIIMPVINSLAKVHEQNLIHRDISPDNIMLCKNSAIKILDFGSARFAKKENEKTYTIVLKHGYAPIEQYSSHSAQGPWTDVYAVAATLYKMITGKRPMDSIERVNNDNLPSPKELGIRLPDYANEAIMRALCVDAKYRTQNMLLFKRGLSGLEQRQPQYMEELYRNRPVQHYNPNYNNYKNEKSAGKAGAVVAVCSIVAALIAVTAVLISNAKKNVVQTVEQTTPMTVATSATQTTMQHTTEPETQTTQETTETTTQPQPQLQLLINSQPSDTVTVAYIESANLKLENIPEDAGDIVCEVEDESVVSVNVVGNIAKRFIPLENLQLNFFGKRIGNTYVNIYLTNYPDIFTRVYVDVILVQGAETTSVDE